MSTNYTNNTNNPSILLGASNRKSFTLIELLVVLALVAILSVVVILTLNPAELIKQARDSNRLSDLSTINTALNLFSADVTSGFMGTSTVVYVSIPSTSPTCSGLGLPTLPSTYTYNCVTSATLRNTDGTGWVPVNFQRISSNSPISQLPIDPINTTSTRLYYTYVSGGSWELNASIEAVKNKLGGSGDLVSKDGGSAASQYEIGNNLNLNPIETGDASLVGYWNFEEGLNATSSDRSGKGNDGTWYGSGTHYSAGKVGSYAGQFNGADDFIPASFNGWANSGITLAVWVKKTGNPASFTQTIGDYGGAGALYIDGSGLIFLQLSLTGGTYGSTKAAMGSDWNFWVGTWQSGDFLKLYQNGVLVGQSGASYTDSILSFSGFGLGYYASGYFNGTMDEARIYNRALSAAEILALYNATK